jgi:hypothetical protein
MKQMPGMGTSQTELALYIAESVKRPFFSNRPTTLFSIVARGHSRKTFAWLWLLFPWRPLYTPPGGIEVPEFH